jgi:hypothetical protein
MLYLSQNGTPKLQISILPSEPPYQVIGLTVTQLIQFLQNCQGFTGLEETINLLQQHRPSFPTLQLKIPLYGTFPSIEIKNTSDMGPSIMLIFAWDFVKELMNSLSTAMANETD